MAARPLGHDRAGLLVQCERDVLEDWTVCDHDAGGVFGEVAREALEVDAILEEGLHLFRAVADGLEVCVRLLRVVTEEDMQGPRAWPCLDRLRDSIDLAERDIERARDVSDDRA